MSSTPETLHLLILMESRNDAEAIISLLRNSGSATRAQMVMSLEEFSEALEEKTWDLLIAEPETHGIGFTDLKDEITRLNKDLPIILVNREIDLIALETVIKRGASTMVPLGENNLLVLAIQREVEHLRVRRSKRELEVRLRDAEKRSQSLLESSRDAVAYVQDGMHIFGNPAYLQMFGFESNDDLEGMPLIDMVDLSGQADFKKFLKQYAQNSFQNNELNTIGVKGDDNLFPMTMTFTSARFADEPCTQVSIQSNEKSTAMEAKLRQISNIDVLTGLFNKPYFMSQLEKAVDYAVLGGGRGAVLYINIDSFGSLRAKHGIARSESVLVELANTLKKLMDGPFNLSRVSEDIFALIMSGISSGEALEQAERLRHHVEDMLIDLGDRTLTITISVGVALLNETNTNPADVLQNAHTACFKVREQEGRENGNGVALYTEQKPQVDDSSVSIEELVTDALKENNFALSFQPLISLKGEETEHYESRFYLSRNGKEMTAGDVLSSTELSDGMKRKIDRWVILNTAKRLGEHSKKGHHTRIFLNLSGPSLLDESLPNWISVAMRAARLPKGAIVVQITEDDVSRMLVQAQKFVNSLHSLGIPCSISRFGCSLDPMKNLQLLPTEYIKVDISYSRNMEEGQLKELLAKLHEQEKQTIVPMVDSANALASLWQMGASFVQGDYVQAAQNDMTYNFEEESSF